MMVLDAIRYLEHGPDSPRVPSNGVRVTAYCQEVALGDKCGEVQWRHLRCPDHGPPQSQDGRGGVEQVGAAQGGRFSKH